MNFDFSEEQQLLRDQARGFLDSQGGAQLARGMLDGDEASATGLWRDMAKMSWMGTAIPEEYGGAGAGALELCVLSEELGRALATTVFSTSVYLATPLLLAAGSEAQKREYLPRLATGEISATLAVSEGPANATPRNVAVAAKDGKLNGEKYPVANAAAADLALVLSAEAGGTFHIVPLAGPDVEVTPIASLDPSRPQGRLHFRNAAAERLGQPGAAWELLRRIYDHAAVFFAFEQVGGAQVALDQACEYARERFAFGRAIGSYQGVKHKLADMYVAATLAKSNCYYAAWALSHDAPELPLAAAAARVSATKAFDLCASESIQVHGGMGCTWETDCHLYYRRARSLAVNIGSNLVWEEKLVRALEAREGEAA